MNDKIKYFLTLETGLILAIIINPQSDRNSLARTLSHLGLYQGLKNHPFSFLNNPKTYNYLTSVTRQLNFKFSQKFQKVTKAIAIILAK